MSQPSYKTNDPRGWCGDPSRGAALGRGSIKDAPADATVELFIRRISIDSGGYDVNGTYWGTPDDLWWAADAEGDVELTCRAPDRPAAESKFRQSYPRATFRSPSLGDEQFEEFFAGYLDVVVDVVDADERENACQEDREEVDICHDSVPDETRAKLRDNAREFWDAHLDDIALLADHVSLGQMGSDLWLSAGGYGVSFEDRVHYKSPEREVARRLSEASDKYGMDATVDDDGKIYVC